MIAIQVNDQATPALRNLLRQAGGATGLKVAARGVANVLRDHFDERDRTDSNKLGGKRTHFWRAVRRSVQTPIVRGSTGVVGINHVGIGQKVRGGTIKPVRAKFLTIPADPRAYGKRAGEFNNLSFGIVDGRPALVESEQTDFKLGRRRKDGSRKITVLGTRGGGVIYWLVKKVHQNADPRALPSDRDLGAGAARALGDWLVINQRR
jgi:hypothetical protein